jgi:hypothetical protein
VRHRRRRLARLRRKYTRVLPWVQSWIAKEKNQVVSASAARDIMQSAGFAQFYSADGVTTRRTRSVKVKVGA